ncbi:MAG: CAP domain-containing protein [Bellilinea sp.]
MRLKIIQLFLLVLIVVASFVFRPVEVVNGQDIDTILGEGVSSPEGSLGLDAVGCTRTNTAPLNLEFEQRVVELVNIERVNAGLPPLKRNDQLDLAVRDHTRDLVEDDYFAHDTMDWVNGELKSVCGPFTRMNLYYTGWSIAGENLAAGYSTPEAVVQGWMSSSGHRDNILNPKFKEIGVGYYQGAAKYTYYWGQDFGAKSDVYPVIINNEALQTTNPLVSSYIYGKGVWAEMRLRTDSGAWSEWVPFQENVTWQLPPINGTHALVVELRAAGAVTAGATSSDVIMLTGILDSEGSVKVFLPFLSR